MLHDRGALLFDSWNKAKFCHTGSVEPVGEGSQAQRGHKGHGTFLILQFSHCVDKASHQIMCLKYSNSSTHTALGSSKSPSLVDPLI